MFIWLKKKGGIDTHTMSGNFFIFKNLLEGKLEGKFNKNTFSKNVNLTAIQIMRKQCLH